MTYRVLVTDDIDPDGVALLTAEPALQVDEFPTLPVAELLERIGEYDAFVGRSATRISPEVLARALRLRVIGRAGVGVDNIALERATELGIAVINAPAGNTVAVAELFFGTVIGLLRHIPRADGTMHTGSWERGRLLGNELRGRTLAIVGLGRIGSEVAIRAHAFGMTLVGYDPYVGDERFAGLRVRRCTTMDELLEAADIVTVHTPLTDETRGMIARRELARLSPGAIVCNLARGGIIDEPSLVAALENGALRGAVLDVYVAEPLATDHPLRKATNVVLTPHLGASTEEAQRNVAVDVCEAVRDALVQGELSRSINLTGGTTGTWDDLRGALIVARRAAALARQLLADRGVKAVQRLTLRCGRDLAGAETLLLSAAAAGALEGVLGTDRLNLINARAVAVQRGLALASSSVDRLGHPRAVEVSLGGGMGELVVAGVAPADGGPRLTRIGGFHVDVPPRQTLIVLTNHDVPGVIGRVGTLLGDAGVNIAEYHQARLAQGGEALAAIAVDSPVREGVRDSLLGLPDVLTASVVDFGE